MTKSFVLTESVLDGDSLQDVVQRIRGKKGTTVSMTIFRPDLDKHLELSVVRDSIPVKTVSTEMIEERGQEDRLHIDYDVRQ